MLPSAVDGIIDCVAGAILGEEGGRKARKGKKSYPISSNPLPFSIPPNLLPLSTPATQAMVL